MAAQVDSIVAAFIQLAPGHFDKLANRAKYLRRALLVVAAGQFGSSIGELLSDVRSLSSVRTFHAYALPPRLGIFAGQWWVHGSMLLVAKTGKGTILSNIGPCNASAGPQGAGEMCNSRESLAFSLAPDGKALVGTVIRISFETWDGTRLQDYDEDLKPPVGVGQKITWRVVRTGLLTTRWPLTYPLGT